MDKVAKPVVAQTFGAQQHAQDCLGGAASGHGQKWTEKSRQTARNGKLADELRYFLSKMQPKINIQSLKIACDDSREK